MLLHTLDFEEIDEDGMVSISGAIEDAPDRIGEVIGYAPAKYRPAHLANVTNQRIGDPQDGATVVAVHPDGRIVLRQAPVDQRILPLMNLRYAVT